ncbi:hypothetical protein ETB97_012424, partial [Aspergillus alliaceus]
MTESLIIILYPTTCLIFSVILLLLLNRTLVIRLLANCAHLIDSENQYIELHAHSDPDSGPEPKPEPEPECDSSENPNYQRMPVTPSECDYLPSAPSYAASTSTDEEDRSLFFPASRPRTRTPLGLDKYFDPETGVLYPRALEACPVIPEWE